MASKPSTHRHRAWVRESSGEWALAVGLPLALSLVCLRSFTRPGYLLQVDIVFGPRPGPVAAGFYAPVALLQNAAVELLGGQAAGRLYAAGALFIAGFAPMVLLRRAPWYARCFAGILGALNPWVYDRMVEGQWSVVVGGAGLFLWVAAWERLQARPGPGSAFLSSLAGAGTVAFSAHMLGPLAVLVLGGTARQRIWSDRRRLQWTLAALGMLAVLLSYGALSFFAGHAERTYQTVKQYTEADFAFFRSTPSPHYGLVVNLLGLYGYWAERLGRFPLAHEAAPWWPLTTGLLVGAALAGAYLQRSRAWLLPCGLLGLAVSASTATGAGRGAAVWLSQRVPLVGAYREPEKWSALWLLAVVTLAAGAVAELARPARRRRAAGRYARAAAPALAYLLALAALFPAGETQIRAMPPILEPLEYPSYWYRTRSYLAHAVAHGDPVVVLPWHLYQPLPMSEGRLVANPARVFFPGEIVVPRNLEIPGRATDIVSRYDRLSVIIGREGHRSCALAREIRLLGVRWVLVLDAAQGARAGRTLRRCGFMLLEGRPGRTSVLRR